MRALLIGHEGQSLQLIREALRKRNHNVTCLEPGQADPETIASGEDSLIIFCEFSPEALALSRRIRAADRENRLAMISVLDHDSITHFEDVLTAGFDQCIVESLYDAKRLDVRLAFAEKLAQDKYRSTVAQRERRRLEQEILHTSEHERRRIGQDLHDGLGQMLTGIGLISKSVARHLEAEGHPLAGQMEEITGLIREADQYARELSRGLVPVELDKEGLAAALERLTAHAEKLFGVACTLATTGEIPLDDANQVTHLFRIAQESVSNAVKHGHATRIDIHLKGTDHYVQLRVDDNGTGFPEDWDEQGGLGVRIMQFRAGLIGATLEISGSDSGGARILCTLPLNDHTQDF